MTMGFELGLSRWTSLLPEIFDLFKKKNKLVTKFLNKTNS